MKSKLKQKIAKWFKITESDLAEYPDSSAKKFGDQKGVTYEMDLLCHTYCSVTNWSNGEGFDISWETEDNTTIRSWEDKRISLHTTELECMFACLNDLRYFDTEGE
ncbi:MAG: hypothetical protein ACYC5G_05220 [Candidatus Doudnabacteria bacterium]